jgi:hypothetical protein
MSRMRALRTRALRMRILRSKISSTMAVDSLTADVDRARLFSYNSDSTEDEQPRYSEDLPLPSEDTTYTTPNEAIAAINNFATVYGYAVSTVRDEEGYAEARLL